jgi:hypothetical protein
MARDATDALGLLAEMAMLDIDSRFLLSYDADDGEWFVHRRYGEMDEDEMARDMDVVRAIRAAYEKWNKER